MALETIKNSIAKWDQVRKTDLGLTFLTSGFGFQVNRVEFDQWNNMTPDQPEFIHIYIGVQEFETVFYLVDSISDANQNYIPGETFFTKNFTKKSLNPGSTWLTEPNDFQIDDIEAAKRAFKWFFHADYWAYKKLHPEGDENEAGMVRAFTIHFEDFKAIFEDSNNQRAFVFFGLKDYYEDGKLLYKNEIEVLTCPEKGFLKPSATSEDVSMPYPPFSASGMNLNLL